MQELSTVGNLHWRQRTTNLLGPSCGPWLRGARRCWYYACTCVATPHLRRSPRRKPADLAFLGELLPWGSSPFVAPHPLVLANTLATGLPCCPSYPAVFVSKTGSTAAEQSWHRVAAECSLHCS